MDCEALDNDFVDVSRVEVPVTSMASNLFAFFSASRVYDAFLFLFNFAARSHTVTAIPFPSVMF